MNLGVLIRAPTCTCPTGLTLPLGLFLSLKVFHSAMTADECHQRAKEAKALAVETQDLWERELLFKIADQWRLLSAHRAAKKQPTILKVVPGRPHSD
jgi:hypothetical protein